MLEVWRIGYCPNPAPPTKSLLAQLGYGSTLGNARWHTKGARQVVYAGSSRALCQLEKRVHSNGANPKDQALMRLEIPDDALLTDVESLGLPTDWQTRMGVTQMLGDVWIDSNSGLGMWVPSVIEAGDSNLLLNPAHTDYQRVQLFIERNPFTFDPRLF